MNVFRFLLFFTIFSSAALPSIALNNDLNYALQRKKNGLSVISDRWMVSAANPYAVEAGAKILARGGSAADAMVAVQSVLGLVEPQSSGIGGGGFLIWFDAASGRITTLDGRETASRHVTPQLFQDESGQPLKFFDAVVGGRSVGVPGTPALMLNAHKRWGKLDWSALFQPGINLAESGFMVSSRLSMLVARDEKRLTRFERTSTYFYPDGKPIKADNILKNLRYAKTLRALASDRGRSFYHGKIARDIVDTVQSDAINPGHLDLSDLAGYRVKERSAVCIAYRDLDVCGMGPPSSGGVAVGQILGMLAGYDLAKMGPNSSDAWRLIGDASRLAFADRGRYIADSDFVLVPVKGLLNEKYLKNRATLLNRKKALETVSPGNPTFHTANSFADDESIELPSTSHISIVDQYGNALSMTTTIENAFGSRLMTKGGFLLNNEMTDFSFRDIKGGVPIANRVEPGKRPRSSMAPTIVLKNGKPYLVIGSPGGSRIIGFVAKAIIAYVDWGMTVQEAVSMPHFINRFGTFDLEINTKAEMMEGHLSFAGFKVKLRGLNSGLHAIAVYEDRLEGGADPRREGLAYGNR
ncbi:gamma-glutamyltransferase [Candidatus Puniceispirillum sp.]|nr:gamma-glutamyltransferase [Candidatus Puniceispirillum sp.]